MILLGQTLGRLGQLECTPDALRIDIVRRLRAREDHFPILSELACYHTVAVGLTALDVELGQVAELALGLAEDPEYQQDEDREQVLYCLSEMIRRPALGGSRQESSALKERILRALFEGARAKVPRVVRFLHTLLASGALPDKLARDVSERLPGWVVSGVDGNELETFA